MKTMVIVLALALSLVGVSYASIQGQRIQDKAISGIANVRSSSASCYLTLNNAKNALISLRDNYGSDVDAGDKTKLVSLFSDITAARASLNTLISNIDTNFPSIND